jgi:RNA polymerase sigma-70 factor (ECF subfamily)
MKPALATLFLGAWDHAAVSSEAIATRLAEIIAAAHTAHPGIAIGADAFVRHLATRADASKPPLEALDLLRTADLFLAAACAAGDRNAILRFESECLRHAEKGLAKRGLSADVVEEAKQNIRERLLVGGGTPRILDFDGKGDLRQWLRVALLREAIHLSKREKRDVPLTFDLFALPDADANPEVAYFKKRYRAEYKEAFEAALVQLGARERALLRQQYILGLNIDEIGAIYQVHRATAARWVQQAREELLSHARLELARRLGLSRAEIEAIVRMIESQLEVSLRRILAAPPQPLPPSESSSD